MDWKTVEIAKKQRVKEELKKKKKTWLRGAHNQHLLHAAQMESRWLNVYGIIMTGEPRAENNICVFFCYGAGSERNLLPYFF